MRCMHVGWSLLLLLFALSDAPAQSLESYRNSLTRQVASGTITSPDHLRDFVQDGRLSVGLRDAILLALQNNSSIRVQETQVDAQKFGVVGAHQLFDPLLLSSINANRYSSPGFSQLQGVGDSNQSVASALNQTAQISYAQTFVSGTSILAGLSSNRLSTNSSLNFYNPYFSSTLNFQFTQPLLRNFGRFANTAPLIIARRALEQSRSSFAATVNDSILQVIQQYWSAVEQRGALDVVQKSLDLAQVSYQRDQHALELGALPPLDIYRSESEVAARKVGVIQAAYALTHAEEALRLTIGAKQDPQLSSIPLNLTEKPEPTGELESIDAQAALQRALDHRPEIDVVREAVSNDETSIRLARNQLLPSLSLQGFYQTSGQGGNQYDLATGLLVAPGGFGSSLDHLFGFGYPGYGGSLTLSLPLKNHAGQASLGNALVSRSRDAYNGRGTRELITEQVDDAIHQLDEAKLALAGGVVSYDLAQKSLAADQRKYELGAETNFFVLDSQTKLAQAELSLLQTQVNYRIAQAALDHATGNLLDPYHVQIIDLSK